MGWWTEQTIAKRTRQSRKQLEKGVRVARATGEATIERLDALIAEQRRTNELLGRLLTRNTQERPPNQ